MFLIHFEQFNSWPAATARAGENRTFSGGAGRYDGFGTTALAANCYRRLVDPDERTGVRKRNFGIVTIRVAMRNT